MAKYSKNIDEDLKDKVMKNEAIAKLAVYGVEIEVISILKSKNCVGEVIKGSNIVSLFTGKPDLVVIALYEDAFLKVDDETQNIWIESLISQISYDIDKEKVIITKPELNITIGMYHKYGNIAIQKAELSLLTIQQIIEKEKEDKAVEKGAISILSKAKIK